MRTFIVIAMSIQILLLCSLVYLTFDIWSDVADINSRLDDIYFRLGRARIY